MAYQRVYIITLFFLGGLHMQAQEPINYSVKNGLPTNHIYDVQEDKNGFIWFATNRGLVKFDGKNFQPFTLKEGLPNNDVWELYLDTKKRLWFFSKSKYQGYILNDSIYSFSTKDNKTINPRIYYEIDSTLWIGDGTYKFNETHFEKQSEIDSAYKEVYSTIDTKSSIDNTNAYYLYDFFENQFIVITQSGLLFMDAAFNIKKRIEIKILKNPEEWATGLFRHDNIWVLMNESEAIFINTANKSTKHLAFRTFAPSYTGSNINPKCVYANNTYQISIPGYLFIFDKHFELIEKHAFPKHLEGNSAFKDSHGNIWVFGFKKGVFLYSAAQLQSDYYLTGKKISVLGQAKDLFIAASETDLEYQFVPETNSFIPIYIHMNTNHITPYKIFTYKNKGYILFQSGAYEYAGNTFKKIHTFDNMGGKDLLFKQDTTILLNVGYINVTTTNNEYNILQEGLLEVDNFKNNVYVGGSDGLLHLKNENLVAPLIKDTLLNTPIIEIKSTAKNLWIGTDGRGVYSYNDSGVEHIKSTDNLSVQAIIPVADTLWLATNDGIKKVVLKTPISESIISHSFYENDGLMQNNVNDIFLKEGHIFVATDMGISKINPDNPIYTKTPQLYFENTSDTLVIRQNDNRNISISFSTLSYGNQEHLAYKYRLLPQEDWTTTPTPVLNFSNLSPSTYTLEVEVTDHHSNTTQRLLTIIVLPKWWETIFAKILFLVTGIGVFSLLVIYIIKYYKTKEQKQQETLQRMNKLELQALRSQMNPHFVHNSLNAIQYYIQRHEVELSENYLSKFSKLIRLFFEYSRRQTISIEEEIKLLKNYLAIEKLRFEDKISYHINVDPKLDVEERSMPTMVLQPIVENAVNHGLFHKKDNGSILISFNYISEHTFEVSIKDDGVGIIKSKEFYRKSAKSYQSRSSAVLEERLNLLKKSKEWNIHFEIKDLSSVDPQKTGTLVHLIITQPIENRL